MSHDRFSPWEYAMIAVQASAQYWSDLKVFCYSSGVRHIYSQQQVSASSRGHLADIIIGSSGRH